MAQLPEEILRNRLTNEIARCQRQLEHKFEIENPDLKTFPVIIHVTLRRCPGPIYDRDMVRHKFSHNFTMRITKYYPYQKPIVTWESEIFHPNIKMPQNGGQVCSVLLDNWGFNSNLLFFIRGLESLLANPNPGNPFGTDSCTMAAQWFHKHPYRPPSIVKSMHHGPKIIGQ